MIAGRCAHFCATEGTEFDGFGLRVVAGSGQSETDAAFGLELGAASTPVRCARTRCASC